MPAVSRRTTVLATLLATLFTTQTTPTAWADWANTNSPNRQVKGGMNGRSITAQTTVQTTVNGAARSLDGGSLSSVDVNWSPPACWYEPAFSPKEIEKTVKAWRNFGKRIPLAGGIGDLVANYLDDRYKDGNPYKNYNLDKQGEGMFWAAVVNPNRKDDPEALACDRPPFWVDKGDAPGEPLAVSAETLASYAYDELPVPDTDIAMAPPTETKVNLPTWIWLESAKFRKVSVTASIPGSGLSATTTAEPVSLTIDPGTADAETFPASGECPIRDGRIGKPRAKGTPAEVLPPCGVQYLRPSGRGGSYELNATLTWRISWTSSQRDGGRLPDGVFGAARKVAVGEIQAVNR
ncbi:hypothetical protein ACIBKX_06620 [Streptomyces sp. NPDC050658]|uniref:hypothetical protein n=1 Tax=unclassified Streptomyces TaxID=2593676 RepID=UPI00342453C5